MSDEKLFEEIKIMFENHLTHKKDRVKLLIKDIEKDTVLSSISYSKVLFDSEMNIYKINDSGIPIMIDNDNFESVIVKQ
jgi:hypothetical protein